MRITFLALNYEPSVGGAQSYVRKVAEGLTARHGHQVEVLTTDAMLPPAGRDPGRIHDREAWIGGVHVRRFPGPRRLHAVLRTGRRLARRAGWPRSHVGSPWTLGPLGTRMAIQCRRSGGRSDAVVGFSSPFMTILAAEWATRGNLAAHVAMPLLHLATAEPPVSVLRSLRRAEACACVTSFERDWLQRHGVDADRLEVLPPGCDPQCYPDMAPAEARSTLGLAARPTVGYLGRLAPHKGIDTFLRSLPAVWERFPDTTALVAGGRTGWAGLDPLVGSIRRVAGDRLVIRENFSEQDKPLLFAACDVVAFPTREESFGMVIVEAWASRRPVVASDLGAIRCVIRSGVDGELIPPDRPEALARSVVGLLEDDNRAREIGLAGRKRAEAEFAWDGIVDRWDSFLGEARSRRDARRVG